MLFLIALSYGIIAINSQIRVSKESKGGVYLLNLVHIRYTDIIKSVHTNRKIPALEYLGCGYDILFGSPFGDPGTLIDPGYREPIISYSIIQKTTSHARRGVFAKINGAWIRPLVACKRSNKVDVVKNIEEYRAIAEIDSDVSVSAIENSAKFSLSTNYSRAKETLKSTGNNIYIDRSYCFLLEAGLPIHSNWKLRRSFILAAKKLGHGFKEATKKCRVVQYSMNPENPDCRESIKPWMDLFDQFGTHFSYNIKIGGKITSVSQESAENNSTNNNRGNSIGIDASVAKHDKGLSANANVSFTFGERRDNGNNLSSKYTNILGGLPVGNINDESEYIKWIKSVYRNPMPIRSQFAPISKLFKSKELRESYDEAFQFYLALSLSS
ncbi:MAC/Perforin domain containing protein [Theileria equi strain WA]|uniref:MAC/Perforin domain containing protein n=1 Tax=Theileria equi strain WA TaxID=1537102 RepID=L1LCH0_THEEQ|nr:MAC/Perforin domain containing protein [Theileria equi strain WA]EKX73137.1 MAC/Perforin domain containing protein [Theileria equi strain WA]|eukprot:XP_004832589.1 MAC/Perforin domain containing protein [Theileria equi strain WA]